MERICKLQKNTEKLYQVPLEVTKETIVDFNIDPKDLVITKIGNRRVLALMITVTEDIYREFMRPLWREDKRKQRADPVISLDKLYDDTEYEISDDYNLEEDFTKKLLVDELHKALDELDEIDRTIVDIFSCGASETEIGKVIGMSQRGVNKRKHKIFEKLKDKLRNFR